jgi:hypothetical protein
MTTMSFGRSVRPNASLFRLLLSAIPSISKKLKERRKPPGVPGWPRWIQMGRIGLRINHEDFNLFHREESAWERRAEVCDGGHSECDLLRRWIWPDVWEW